MNSAQNSLILVTGSTGRLGTLLRAAWARWVNPPVHALFTARHAPTDLVLNGEGPLPELPRCDTVLALWGETSSNPDRRDVNASLALQTRKVARACGAVRVFHLSSAAVYGPGTRMSEAQNPSPHNHYGNSKYLMEQVVREFQEDAAVHCCLRLANVVGADSLAPALGQDQPVMLDRFKDGTGPMRSYIAPNSLLRVLVGLSALPPQSLPPVLNVAATEPIAMEDLALACEKQIEWRPAPATATHEVSLDTQMLSALLPHLDLRQDASDMIADWKSIWRVE